VGDVGRDDAAGATGATGAGADGEDGAGAGVTTGAAVVDVGTGDDDTSAGATVAFFVRDFAVFFASGASVLSPSASVLAADFFAFLGFSAAGSRFKPFSSA